MRTLLRQMPAAAFGQEAREGAKSVLGGVWQRAEAERRALLLSALRRVAAAM